MDLQNGYKIIYEAPSRVTTEKPGKFYASKTIPEANDAMLISFNNGAEYVDLKQFKLLYSDGKHLLGSVSGIPAANDINIVIKNTNGEIVYGEVIAVEVKAEAAPKKAKKVVVEEPVAEEVKVEE